MATTQPYEILMRRNGQSWALQARSLTTLDDGSAIEGKAVPLAGLSDPAFAEVATLVSASKDNEITTLTAERDSLTQQLASMTTERDTALSEKASLQAQLDMANATVATVETLHADKVTLETANAELTSERDTAVSQLEVANERVTTFETRIAELTAEPEVTIVSRRQARLALLQLGYFEQVESAVYSGPKGIQIEYEADVWRRDNPTLVAMAEQLGMNAEQIDQFFALAGTL